MLNIDPWVMSLRTNTTRQLFLKPRQEGCHPLFWFCRSHYCLFSGFVYISRTFLMNELFVINLLRTLNSKAFHKNVWINVITICNWWGPITELFSLSHLDSFKVYFCVYPFFTQLSCVYLFSVVHSRWKIIFTRFLLQKASAWLMLCCNTLNLHNHQIKK